MLQHSKRNNYRERCKREQAKQVRIAQSMKNSSDNEKINLFEEEKNMNNETQLKKLQRRLKHKSIDGNRDYQIIKDESKNDPLYQYCRDKIMTHHYIDHYTYHQKQFKTHPYTIDQLVTQNYSRVIADSKSIPCQVCLALEKKYNKLQQQEEQKKLLENQEKQFDNNSQSKE